MLYEVITVIGNKISKHKFKIYKSIGDGGDGVDVIVITSYSIHYTKLYDQEYKFAGEEVSYQFDEIAAKLKEYKDDDSDEYHRIKLQVEKFYE